MSRPIRPPDDRRAARSRRFLRLPADAVRDRRLRRPAGGARAINDRQRLDLHAVAGRLLHGLDLFRQRGPSGRLRGLVPADLPWADAGDALGGTRGAEDDPHREDLPDHLDRRLHRQPLRQEPASRRAGHADHRRRNRPLHRAAVEGGVRGLSRAHRRSGVARGTGGRLVAGRHAPGRAGAGGVHHRVRHAAPRQYRAARGHGRGHRLRVRSSSWSPSSRWAAS